MGNALPFIHFWSLTCLSLSLPHSSRYLWSALFADEFEWQTKVCATILCALWVRVSASMKREEEMKSDREKHSYKEACAFVDLFFFFLALVFCLQFSFRREFVFRVHRKAAWALSWALMIRVRRDDKQSPFIFRERKNGGELLFIAVPFQLNGINLALAISVAPDSVFLNRSNDLDSHWGPSDWWAPHYDVIDAEWRQTISGDVRRFAIENKSANRIPLFFESNLEFGHFWYGDSHADFFVFLPNRKKEKKKFRCFSAALIERKCLSRRSKRKAATLKSAFWFKNSKICWERQRNVIYRRRVGWFFPEWKKKTDISGSTITYFGLMMW